MRMYQYDKHLDFHALGREIKRKREAKGWTQEYLAQLVNRTPRSIMYIENLGGSIPALTPFTNLFLCWRFPWINSFSLTSLTERVPVGSRLMSCSIR